jgi:hypothetical protein
MRTPILLISIVLLSGIFLQTSSLYGVGEVELGGGFVENAGNCSYSFAAGDSTIWDSEYGFTGGHSSVDQSSYGVAFGKSIAFESPYGMALGNSYIESAPGAVAIGQGIKGYIPYSTILGTYNTIQPRNSPIRFAIGIGTSESDRSDALQISRVGTGMPSVSVLGNLSASSLQVSGQMHVQTLVSDTIAGSVDDIGLDLGSGQLSYYDSGTTRMIFAYSGLIPASNNELSLGTDSLRFKSLCLSGHIYLNNEARLYSKLAGTTTNAEFLRFSGGNDVVMGQNANRLYFRTSDSSNATKLLINNDGLIYFGASQKTKLQADYGKLWVANSSNNWGAIYSKHLENLDGTDAFYINFFSDKPVVIGMATSQSGGKPSRLDLYGDFRLREDANTTNNIVFLNNDTSGTASYINTHGNLGIGTTTPQAKLDVAGDVRTQNLTVVGTLAATTISGKFIGDGSGLTNLPEGISSADRERLEALSNLLDVIRVEGGVVKLVSRQGDIPMFGDQ